ncbi:MAG: flavodoxin family protein [Desulfovibrionaceae bacterium]|nr:flavodoxin family protein [Desulfovibrionaceae bacterium]
MSVFLLQASSNACGVTAHLARHIEDALTRETIRVDLCTLSSQTIHPCTNCGFCRTHRACVFDREDDKASAILDAMRACQLLILVAPIYFYALPAQCKALVDRSQRYWHAQRTSKTRKPSLVLLHAGRKKGDKLFDGAILTLRYFLDLLSRTILATCVRRGLETREDLLADADYLHGIDEMMRHLAISLKNTGTADEKNADYAAFFAEQKKWQLTQDTYAVCRNLSQMSSKGVSRWQEKDKLSP